MKILQEIPDYLDDNGEGDEGCQVVESTIGELGKLKTGTACGTVGNTCFSSFLNRGWNDRLVCGWYRKDENSVWGMFHIECNIEESNLISDLASEAEGSLRVNGSSLREGFMEFEIE